MLKINTKKEKKTKEENKKKSIIPRYITFLILSIILGGIFTALTSYAATIAASNISYSNTTSGLTATNTQDAVNEIYRKSKNYINTSKNLSLSGTYTFSNDVTVDFSNFNEFRVYKQDDENVYLVSKNVTPKIGSGSVATNVATYNGYVNENASVTGCSTAEVNLFPYSSETRNVSPSCSTTSSTKTYGSEIQSKLGGPGYTLDTGDMVESYCTYATKQTIGKANDCSMSIGSPTPTVSVLTSSGWETSWVSTSQRKATTAANGRPSFSNTVLKSSCEFKIEVKLPKICLS